VAFDERFHSIGLNDWMSHLASFRAIEHYFLQEPSRSGEDTETREYLSTKERLSNAFPKEYDFFLLARAGCCSFDHHHLLTITKSPLHSHNHHRLPNIKTPDYLDGTIAGDYGFDPLGLGSDPERLKYYQEAELMNARWAMMAVAGICTTEALGIQSKWYMAGQEDYGFPINAQLAVLFPTMGFLETKRITGWLATGKSGINETFPFDPLGMGADSDSMKLKEIKNGRAAMIAFVGICVQALVLREGPLAALQDHVANPFGNNLATNVMNLPINLA